MRTLAILLLALGGVGGLAACSSTPATLSPEDERVLRPVPDMTPEVRPLVERGDALFVEALPPHHNGDTATALDRYSRARASYLEAQTHYSGLVPQPLLDRVKACVLRIAELQRKRHSGS